MAMRQFNTAARAGAAICWGVVIEVACVGLASAADCADGVVTEQEINVSSGVYTERAVATVPMKIRIPVGTDTGLQAECLRRQGRDGESRMAAEVTRAERCGEEARRVRLTRDERGQVASIGNAVDTAAYAACLEGAVEVEVLPAE